MATWLVGDGLTCGQQASQFSGLFKKVAKHPGAMRARELQSSLRYIFQADDIPMDVALLGMEDDGTVLFLSDGSVSLTDMGEKARRMEAKRSKSRSGFYLGCVLLGEVPNDYTPGLSQKNIHPVEGALS